MDGKKHHLFRDLTGSKFGLLTAISPLRSTGKKWVWLFVCDCGGTCEKVGSDVTKAHGKGQLVNCGCLTRSIISQSRTRHGMSKHPAYAVWRSMLDRCRLPSHQAWANYGGRGIEVCLRWRERFENFWEDMGPTYRRGLQIDRRGNDGNYSPENCRWVSAQINTRNRRNNVEIPTPLGSMTVAEASEAFGIGKTTLHFRLRNGWPPDRLLILPDFRNRESSTC